MLNVPAWGQPEAPNASLRVSLAPEALAGCIGAAAGKGGTASSCAVHYPILRHEPARARERAGGAAGGKEVDVRLRQGFAVLVCSSSSLQSL